MAFGKGLVATTPFANLFAYCVRIISEQQLLPVGSANSMTVPCKAFHDTTNILKGIVNGGK